MGVVLGSSNYDTLKFVAQILLPGVGAAYFALAQIWGLPFADEIVGTITVLDTFLGLFLHQSKKAYDQSDEKFDGELSDERGLELNEAPNDKQELVIKVVNPPNFERKME